MKLTHLAIIFALLVTACSSDTSSQEPLPYQQLNRISLNVKDLSFVDRGIDHYPATPLLVPPLQPTVTDAVHRWATDRLQAVGNDGLAAFVVKNAYVTEEKIPTDSSWFERKQASKMTAHVEIEFDARNNQSYGLATANAVRSVSVPENPTDGERQDAYNRLIDGLMVDLDKYLDQAIHEHMREFIVTDPVIGSKLPPQSPNQAP